MTNIMQMSSAAVLEVSVLPRILGANVKNGCGGKYGDSWVIEKQRTMKIYVF